MLSKKATKIDKIFAVNLSVISNLQINSEDFVNLCGLHRKHELYQQFEIVKAKSTWPTHNHRKKKQIMKSRNENNAFFNDFFHQTLKNVVTLAVGGKSYRKFYHRICEMVILT